jgi:heme A synthase
LLVAAWQLISGMSNVVLYWPIVAALAHTGGAAMLLLLLGSMLAQMQQGRGLPQRSAAVASKQTALDSRISIP